MNPKAIVDIDQQIGQLEKQLSVLYSKRVSALEAEIARSKSRIEAFNGSVSTAEATFVAKAAVVQPLKRKVRSSKRQPAKTKPAPQPAAQVAPPAVKTQAASAKPAQAPAKEEAAVQLVQAPAKKAAARKLQHPKKRTRTPSAVVEKRILDALKEAGLFGLSQIDLSKKTGLGYQTVVKKLKELPQITKKGSGKEGRFLLKA
jgi:hypothetical protein